jgi:hypothetical protein
LVDRLIGAFDRTAEPTTGPQIVTIEADTGWGKTRLVKEFYAPLAKDRQSTDGYWPPTIDGTVIGPTSVLRKVIHPQQFKPGQDVMTWFWWGLSAGRRPVGAPVQALVEDLAQITAHLDGLQRAFDNRASKRVKARVRLAPKGTGAAVTTAIRDDGIGAALAVTGATGPALTVAGATVPVLGLGILAASLAHGGAKASWRSHRRTVTAGTRMVDTTGLADTDLVATIAKQVDLYARTASTPMVIVVEDGHDADDALVDLLTQLLNGDAPVLIIVTAWPRTLDDPCRPAHRLVGYDVPAARRTRLAGDDLPELDETERTALVEGSLPGITHEQARLLARRYRSPHSIEQVCSTVAVRRLVEQDRLDDANLDKLPLDAVEDVHRAVWAQLPEGVKHRLAIDTVMAPSAIHDLFADDHWDDPTVDDVTANIDWIPTTDETGYGWVTGVDDRVHVFVDPAQQAIARRHAADLLTPDDTAAVRSSVDRNHCPPDTALSRLWHAKVAVGMALAGSAPWTPSVHDDVDLLLLAALDNPRHDDARFALALLDRVPEHAPSAEVRRDVRTRAQIELGHPVPLGGQDPKARFAAAAARIMDDPAGVVEELRVVADMLSAQRGQDHPETLVARTTLATALMLAGDASDAAELTGQVMRDATAAHGTVHDLTVSATIHHANAAQAAGRAGEAITATAALAAELTGFLGANAPLTLTVRARHAEALVADHRVAEAATRLATIADAAATALGTASPLAIDLAGQAAVLAHRIGNAGDAGAGKPPSMTERLNPWTAKSGSLATPLHGPIDETAVAALLTRADTYLGPRHPVALRTAARLATPHPSLGFTASGDPIDAVVHLNESGHAIALEVPALQRAHRICALLDPRTGDGARCDRCDRELHSLLTPLIADGTVRTVDVEGFHWPAWALLAFGLRSSRAAELVARPDRPTWDLDRALGTNHLYHQSVLADHRWHLVGSATLIGDTCGIVVRLSASGRGVCGTSLSPDVGRVSDDVYPVCEDCAGQVHRAVAALAAAAPAVPDRFDPDQHGRPVAIAVTRRPDAHLELLQGWEPVHGGPPRHAPVHVEVGQQLCGRPVARGAGGCDACIGALAPLAASLDRAWAGYLGAGVATDDDAEGNGDLFGATTVVIDGNAFPAEVIGAPAETAVNREVLLIVPFDDADSADYFPIGHDSALLAGAAAAGRLRRQPGGPTDIYSPQAVDGTTHLHQTAHSQTDAGGQGWVAPVPDLGSLCQSTPRESDRDWAEDGLDRGGPDDVLVDGVCAACINNLIVHCSRRGVSAAIGDLAFDASFMADTLAPLLIASMLA